MEYINRNFNSKAPAENRLAFREGGLSLGLRAVFHDKDYIRAIVGRVDELDQFASLADQIDRFWMNEENQRSGAWSNHKDINSIMLSATLLS